MATITLILNDTPAGGVSVRSDFRPAMGHPVTPAQAQALDLIASTHSRPSTMSTREIISQKQASILAVLETVVDARHEFLQEKVGLPNGDYKRQISDLRLRDMVVAGKPSCGHPILLHISRAGVQALADHIEHHSYIMQQKVKTEPARINLMKQPAYVPHTSYCRNNGHAHLPSLGSA